MDQWWMYNPNQSFGLDSNAYDLGGSGNNYNTVGYTPSYGGTGDYTVGGSGGSGGSFDTVSYDLGGGYGGDFGRVSQGGGGGGAGNAWWDTPSFTPSFTQQYSAPAFTPTYSLGAGTGTNMFSMGNTGVGAQAGGGSFGTATAGQGNFGGVTVGGGGFGSGSFTTTPASSNGSAPAFGVDPNAYNLSDPNRGAGTDQQQTPTLAQYAERGAAALKEGAGYVKDKVGGALSAVDEYTRTNPMGARLGLEGAGMLIGAYNQRNANKEARRVNDMQTRDRENLRALQAEQLRMQREALNRNNQQADQFNTQATQSLNEARSLYNPQEMAIRAMAQQQMGTQNLITEGERDMRRRGMSDATIAAETRRARLGGTTGATTAYTKGLDVGRVAQQGALSSAKSLSQQYGSPTLTTSLGGDVDYSLANALSKSGADTTANLKAMLNLYLDDPITRSDQEIRRRMQKESVK